MIKFFVSFLSFCLIVINFTTCVNAKENENTNGNSRISTVAIPVSLSVTKVHNAKDSSTTIYGYVVYNLAVSASIYPTGTNTFTKKNVSVTLTKKDWEAPFEPYFQIVSYRFYCSNNQYYITVNIKCNLHSSDGSSYTTHSYTYQLQKN